MRTDGWFGHLLLFQWLAAIAVALWVSPLTWEGTTARPISTSGAAFFLGAAIIALPLALIFWRRGQTITRHTIAAAQMLMGALLIHLCGGRIETHFHVFGSLAFLAFYRDWRVLLTGTVVVAADHFLRGMFWPMSVFGTTVASNWRWLEHAGWVVFEDLFLIRSCLQGTKEIHEIAEKQAAQEAGPGRRRGNGGPANPRTALERGPQGRGSRSGPSTASSPSMQDGRIVEANPAVETTFGYRRDEILGKELAAARLSPRPAATGTATGSCRRARSSSMHGRVELPAQRADGTAFPVELTVTPIRTRRTDAVHRLHARRHRATRMRSAPCVRPRKPPRRRTGPRANSWPT